MLARRGHRTACVFGVAVALTGWLILRNLRGPVPPDVYYPDRGFRDKSDLSAFAVGVNTGGKITFELQDSDVVCLRSAAADADGYHSLIQTAGAGYEMPPLATVTLEKVQQPGEWEVRGLKVQQRLFTVRVAYK